MGGSREWQLELVLLMMGQVDDGHGRVDGCQYRWPSWGVGISTGSMDFFITKTKDKDKNNKV